MIDRITEAKLAEGVANATVNRTYWKCCARFCANASMNGNGSIRAPHGSDAEGADPPHSFLHPPGGTTGCYAELPEHLADMVAFSLATGLRRLERHRFAVVAGGFGKEGWRGFMRIRQKRGRRCRCRSTRRRCVIVRKQLGKHPTHVFSYRGKPITQVSTKAWYAALERAGIEDFRWHDLRHTWASWHVQNGTPLFALQEMGGWESRGDGAALCAPRRGSPGAFCRASVCFACRRCGDRRHKKVTVRKLKGPSRS